MIQERNESGIYTKGPNGRPLVGLTEVDDGSLYKFVWVDHPLEVTQVWPEDSFFTDEHNVAARAFHFREQGILVLLEDLEIPGVPRVLQKNILTKGVVFSRNSPPQTHPLYRVGFRMERLQGLTLAQIDDAIVTDEDAVGHILRTGKLLTTIFERTKNTKLPILAHGDLDPANIGYDAASHTNWIIDWGSAIIAPYKDKDIGSTFLYMSKTINMPEVKLATSWIDVVSLVKTLLYLKWGGIYEILYDPIQNSDKISHKPDKVDTLNSVSIDFLTWVLDGENDVARSNDATRKYFQAIHSIPFSRDLALLCKTVIQHDLGITDQQSLESIPENIATVPAFIDTLSNIKIPEHQPVA